MKKLKIVNDNSELLSKSGADLVNESYRKEALHMRLESFIYNVNNFPKSGVAFKDITPLLENSAAFSKVIAEMAHEYSTVAIDKIICADARGFVFGAALSVALNVGLVLARKSGKLPRPGYSVTYNLEYGSNTLEISAGAISSSERVLVVDDLLATGGSAEAMSKLVALSGGVVVGYSFCIELLELNGRNSLVAGVPIKSVLKYGVSIGQHVVVDLRSIVDEDQLRYAGEYETTVISMDESSVTVNYDLDTQMGTLRVGRDKIISVAVDGMYYRYLS